jgi:hypothetical protein
VKLPAKFGMLLAAIWLIATGVLVLVPNVSFSGKENVLALLAIAAGVLIILDR